MISNNLINLDKFFFVIDSNNLANVDTHLYGNIVSERGIFTNEHLSLLQPSDLENQDGMYVFVSVSNNKITVKQDWHGKYGLYLYKNEDHFCLSNSFYYLVNYLAKNNYPFTSNIEHVRYMYVVGMCSANHNSSMVNEITLLPRNCYLEIDINTKKLNIIEFEQPRRFIELDSKEAIQIIDKWYLKWRHFIENLCNKSKYVTDEISGGVDSRVTFMLFNTANIDHQAVKYYSITEKFQPVDFKNATAIANKCGIELNKSFNIPQLRMSIGDVLNIHTYGKLFFHNYNTSYHYVNQTHSFVFDGYFGENLRGFYLTDMTEQDFLDAIKERSTGTNDALYQSALKLCKDSVDTMKKRYNPIDDRELFIELYEETRARHHFGLLSVERMMKNKTNISPLADKNLSFIKQYNENCKDSLLLVALIFTRFCPQLLDLPFNGVKSIDMNSELRIEAERINKKYPFKNKTIKLDDNFVMPDSNLTNIEPHYPSFLTPRRISYEALLNSVYKTKFTKELICKNLGKEVYECNNNDINQHQSIHSLLPLIGYSIIEMTRQSKFKSQNKTAIDYCFEIINSDYGEPLFSFWKK